MDREQVIWIAICSTELALATGCGGIGELYGSPAGLIAFGIGQFIAGMAFLAFKMREEW